MSCRELHIRVHKVRRLKTQEFEEDFGRRCLRAQASVLDDVQEAGPSSWGRGSASMEAVWKRGGDEMTWKISEGKFKEIRAYTPKVKVHVYSTAKASGDSPSTENSEAVGYVVLDLRDIEARSLQGQWLPLRGTGSSPPEIKISAQLQVVSDKALRSPQPEERATVAATTSTTGAATTGAGTPIALPAAQQLVDLDALPIGPDSSSSEARTFTLAINLRGATGLHAIAPQMDDMGVKFWFSYRTFDVLVQTDQFDKLRAPPYAALFPPITDTFRLRGTLPDMVSFLAEQPPITLYLCTEQRILAHAELSLSGLLPVQVWHGRDASAFTQASAESDLLLTQPGGAAVTSRDDEGEQPPVVKVALELLKVDEEPEAEAEAEEEEKNLWGDEGKEKELTGDQAKEEKEEEARNDADEVLVKVRLSSLQLEPPGDDEDITLQSSGVLVQIEGSGKREGQGADGPCAPVLLPVGDYGEVEVFESSVPRVEWCWQGSCRSCQEGSSSFACVNVYSKANNAHLARGDIPWVLAKQKAAEVEIELLGGSTGNEVLGSCKVLIAKASRCEEAGASGRAPELPLEGEDAVALSQPKWFRLTINLASVKDLDRAAYMVGYYQYPHFGTTAPVRTAVTWVPPHSDTPFTRSHCRFDFGMSLAELREIVENEPLVVSLRTKDKFQEEEAGACMLPLAQLAHTKPTYFRCPETGKTFRTMHGFRGYQKTRQQDREISAPHAESIRPVGVSVIDSYLTVLTPADAQGDAPQRLCSMRAVLWLEDLGPTGESPMPATTHPQALPAEAGAAAPGHAPAAALASDGPPSQLPPWSYGREGASAAEIEGIEAMRIEWEAWRSKAEAEWTQQLLAKDLALEEKWRAKDDERRQSLLAAQQEYRKLETKLRRALTEVGGRERAMKAREEEHRSQHAQKVSELQLLQRRLRDETKHQVELERMKATELEKRLKTTKKALEMAETRARSAEEEFDKYRQTQRRTHEGGLRQELVKVGAEKAELQASLERERSNKNAALLEKEEMRVNVHRLARALKRYQEKEAAASKRELEQMRLEYLAREERYMLDGDRKELKNIRQELDELRHVSLVQEAAKSLNVVVGESNQQRQRPMQPTQHAPSSNVPDRQPQQEELSASPVPEAEEAQDEIARLKSWKMQLMSTGVYSTDDPIMQQIDRRIALASLD